VLVDSRSPMLLKSVPIFLTFLSRLNPFNHQKNHRFSYDIYAKNGKNSAN